MPVELLTAAERERLSRFPEEIPPEDLARHFSLTEEDLRAARSLYGEASRLGFALQLAALRFLGFVPAGLRAAPVEAVRYVAEQIGAAPDALASYGARPKTVREHQVRAKRHLGLRRLEAAKTKSASRHGLSSAPWSTTARPFSSKPLLKSCAASTSSGPASLSSSAWWPPHAQKRTRCRSGGSLRC